MFIIAFLGCVAPEVSDGFGSETTTGTAASFSFGLSGSSRSVEFEVSFIPVDYNPIADSLVTIFRDTTDIDGVLKLDSIVEDTYNITVRSLDSELDEKLKLSEIELSDSTFKEIKETLTPSGGVKLLFTRADQVEGYNFYIPGSEVNQKGSIYTEEIHYDEGLEKDVNFFVITIDSLPSGEYSPIYTWDNTYDIGYAVTETFEIVPDSTIIATMQI